MFYKLYRMLFWKKEMRKGLDNMLIHMDNLDDNLNKVDKDIVEIKLNLDGKTIADAIGNDLIEGK